VKGEWTDEKAERWIARLLQGGVLTAAVIVAAGAVVFLARHGASRPQYAVFESQPPELRSIPGILHASASISGRGLIQLGLLILIATPIARVAFSIVVFALQRDRLYVAITVAVLAILLWSLTAAGH
jgi:uncharacterized membrane protein